MFKGTLATLTYKGTPHLPQIQRTGTSLSRGALLTAPSLHSQWFSVLSQVHASTEQEIREMHDEQANPQNAVVSVDDGTPGCRAVREWPEVAPGLCLLSLKIRKARSFGLKTML